MKTKFFKPANMFLFFSLSCLIWSCSNDNSDLGLNSSIVGNWIWVSSSGGIAGTTETPESTGNNRRLEITNDSTRTFLNGNLISSQKYTLETRESLLFSGVRTMMISEGGFRTIVEFDSGNLILIGDCFDCFSSVYKRE